MGFREPDARQLAIRDCLTRLVHTYSRACDRRDFVLLRSLYHDDALEEHGEMFTGTPDAYVVWLRRALANWSSTTHYVANTLFEIDGEYAEGEIYKINHHRTLDDREDVITGSRSLDRFACRDGEWRFIGRCVTLDWSQRRPAQDQATAGFAAKSPLGSPDERDVSYGRLALFKRARSTTETVFQEG